MEKELKIDIPNGYEIDKENSTFECIKFKPIKKELPKTWEEYCRTHKRQYGESWLTEDSKIENIDIDIAGDKYYKDVVKDKNILPNKEYAEAMLALCQLIQLRDCYNDGWVPNWNNIGAKHSICIKNDDIIPCITSNIQCVLTFKSEKLCNEFLNNFRNLIEIAKPLL